MDGDDDYDYQDDDDEVDFDFDDEPEAEEAEKPEGEEKETTENPDIPSEEIEAINEEHQVKTTKFKERPPENTFPYLTPYEITRLVGNRAKQIDAGKKLYVKPIMGEKNYETAYRELKDGVCPLIIERTDPSRGVKYSINPNEINPVTGERWFNPEIVNFVIQ